MSGRCFLRIVDRYYRFYGKARGWARPRRPGFWIESPVTVKCLFSNDRHQVKSGMTIRAMDSLMREGVSSYPGSSLTQAASIKTLP